MRFFDTHLHLPTPDAAGVEAFLRFAHEEPGLIGGALILNTFEEAAAVMASLQHFPGSVVMIPYFCQAGSVPLPLQRAGWYKVHPILHNIDEAAIPSLVNSLQRQRPRGVMVHCFPWGPELKFNISLPLVIALARALPDTTILATHGGGYESWAFRSHAGAFKNVHFDFSLTLDYYEGADALRPLQRYLRYSKSRVHFGSDWPSGRVAAQLTEMQRLAREVGLGVAELESLLLENARACWPSAFD